MLSKRRRLVAALLLGMIIVLFVVLRSEIQRKRTQELHAALEHGDYDTAQALANKGVDLQASFQGGGTLGRKLAALRNYVLYRAVSDNDLPRAQKLIAHGANVNGRYPGGPGGTLLEAMAAYASPDMVQMLEAHGAQAKNRRAQLVLAAKMNRVAHLRQLLQHGGADGANSANTRDQKGDSLLAHAAQYGALETLHLLLERGALVDARNNSGMTPLHWAAVSGQVEAMRVLLAHGADKNARDQRGYSVRKFAQWSPHQAAALAALASSTEPPRHGSGAQNKGLK